jgi:hypothetical protein
MSLTRREILDRYGPTMALIAAVVILVAVFPASKSTRVDSELTAGEGAAAADAENVAAEAGGAAAGPAAGRVSGGDRSGAGAGGIGGGGSGNIASAGSALAAGPKVCRPDGRMPGISRVMAPCVALFRGNNGGATAKGVTGKTINVVRYMAQVSQATQAALIAAGADDARADTDRMDAATVDYFRLHYESYGRAVKVIVMEASGPSTDDSIMRADAKTIADKHKAFAMWFGSGASDTLAEEVTDRGVICICTVSLSTRFYSAHRDRIFSSLPTAEEYYKATAEYIGKRLAGRPARHAGTGVQNKPRKIGLVYLEATSNGPRRHAKEGRDFFAAEMRKYGVAVTKAVGYSSDLTRSQEQTTNVISQLVAAGVTTVALSADPLFPIFLTKEATRQAFFPEWLIMGTALTDTSFFGRTYDQTQWQHAFGLSPLWVFWTDVSTSSGYREYHHMRPGANRGDEGVSINTRRSPIQWLFLGIHMAGPRLTPQTFAQGMYNFPRSGGTPDVPLVFFTRQYPTAIKDFTEVWWNTQRGGRDETGKDGPGVLMKVDGGKRWLTGTWPRTVPKVFNPAGAVFTKDFPAVRHEQDGHKHNLSKKCMSC